MSLMVCADCGTAYLPADACPHCGGGVYRFGWEEEDMPKATVEGGASGHEEGRTHPEAYVAGTPVLTPAEPKPEPKPKPAARPPAKAAADK